jgi:hypothetical protein
MISKTTFTRMLSTIRNAGNKILRSPLMDVSAKRLKKSVNRKLPTPTSRTYLRNGREWRLAKYFLLTPKRGPRYKSG